jgi:hypothetical protein
MEAFCNLGYATGCDWAPRDRIWDALRFAIVAPPDAGKRPKTGSDSFPVIRICYVYERDHRPAEQGDLEFDLQQNTWRRSHENPRLQKMAECFLESYLNKRS